LAGPGYAVNVQDTMTIHANTARVAKEVPERTVARRTPSLKRSVTRYSAANRFAILPYAMRLVAQFSASVRQAT
jgi:hypothetical protein